MIKKYSKKFLSFGLSVGMPILSMLQATCGTPITNMTTTNGSLLSPSAFNNSSTEESSSVSATLTLLSAILIPTTIACACMCFSKYCINPNDLREEELIAQYRATRPIRSSGTLGSDQALLEITPLEEPHTDTDQSQETRSRMRKHQISSNRTEQRKAKRRKDRSHLNPYPKKGGHHHHPPPPPPATSCLTLSTAYSLGLTKSHDSGFGSSSSLDQTKPSECSRELIPALTLNMPVC